jgi:hypothetical protein
MMTRRQPLAKLAAVTAAVALALPIASASAASPTPAIPSPFVGPDGRLVSGSFPCQVLFREVQFAFLTGNTLWANVVSNAFVYSGCGGAAI